MSNRPTIILKYPTRSRPDLFKSTLRKYIDTADGVLHIVVTIDRDDFTMNTPAMKQWVEEQGAEVHVNGKRGKITAINAHIPSEGWDILVLASDDHLPVVQGWDTRIITDMPEDLDALLWYTDIRQDRICLMPVMGRTYYGRFGYIYAPSYVSLWCDNEQTEVARGIGKLIQPGVELFRNESSDWGGSIKTDRLYRMNNSYYYRDQKNYQRRKKLGFPL